MYAKVGEAKVNDDKVVANFAIQKKSSVKQGFGFVDNRRTCNKLNAWSSAFQLKSDMLSSSTQVAQLKTSALIADNKAEVEGFSGEPTKDVTDKLEEWPALYNEFKSKVQDKDVYRRNSSGHKINESNEETADDSAALLQSNRSKYQCAEPHALANLLATKFKGLEPIDLGTDYMATVKFKRRAYDESYKKEIKPCDVCEQWINDADKPTIKLFSGVDMKNKNFTDPVRKQNRETMEKQKKETEQREQEKKKLAKEKETLLCGYNRELDEILDDDNESFLSNRKDCEEAIDSYIKGLSKSQQQSIHAIHGTVYAIVKKIVKSRLDTYRSNIELETLKDDEKKQELLDKIIKEVDKLLETIKNDVEREISKYIDIKE